MKQREHMLKPKEDGVLVTISTVCLKVRSIRRGGNVVLLCVVSARAIGKPAG